jgi:hypothetical protein
MQTSPSSEGGRLVEFSCERGDNLVALPHVLNQILAWRALPIVIRDNNEPAIAIIGPSGVHAYVTVKIHVVLLSVGEK